MNHGLPSPSKGEGLGMRVWAADAEAKPMEAPPALIHKPRALTLSPGLSPFEGERSQRYPTPPECAFNASINARTAGAIWRCCG